MPNFEDGSYSSTAGLALIAKVLAGRCQMYYTRVAVGSGTIPEGMTPKSMTEPAGYVMDAKISSVGNPVDGECQVSVQINSSDVTDGFYATGLLLYAADPDEGEVPYTYLVLENDPEFIRPASAAVGKLATFDLIAAVGEVDKVTATIDPDSIVTRTAVEQMIADSITRQDVVIPAEGWMDSQTGSDTEDKADTFYLDITIDGVSKEMVPVLTLFPDSQPTAQACEMSSCCRTENGILRLYANKIPSKDMNASLLLLNTNPSGSDNTKADIDEKI